MISMGLLVPYLSLINKIFLVAKTVRLVMKVYTFQLTTLKTTGKQTGQYNFRKDFWVCYHRDRGKKLANS